MQLTSQLDLLHQQLNIPSDNHTHILPTLCRNFLKKYENRPHLHIAQLSLDLKHITAQIDVYSQYTYETIAKYQSLHKLQVLVRGIIESQSSIITYMANRISQTLGQRFNSQNKIQSMVNRVYERCQNCMKSLRRANIEAIQDEMGLKFKDMYNYFMHDMDEISRLSQEASLIFRKKMLNIQGIAEEEYMQKFQKMYENVSTTIDHVAGSLINITKFQEKFRQLQQHQNGLSGQDRLFQNKFDSKKYAINFSKHFNNKIQQLKSKLDRIKTFFVTMTNVEIQTEMNFAECSPEKIEQLNKQIVDMEQEKKQAQIYSGIIDKQMKQDKSKFKALENNFSALKIEKQKFEQKARKLEIELAFVKDRYLGNESTSDKKIEADKKIYESMLKNEGNKSTKEQVKSQIKSLKKIKSKKMIETEEVQVEKQQIRNVIDKKILKHSNYNPNSTSKKQLKQMQIGERDLNMKGYYNRKTSKIKTDQYTEMKQKNANERKVKIFSQTQENLNKMESQIPKVAKQNKHVQPGRENSEIKTRSVEEESQESQHDQSSQIIKTAFTIQKQTEIKVIPTGAGKNENSLYIKRKFFQKLVPQQSTNYQNSNEHRSNQYFLQKIYNNSETSLKHHISLHQFREQIEEVIKQILNVRSQESQEAGEIKIKEKEEPSRHKNKTKSLSRISIEMKNIKKDSSAEVVHQVSGLGENQLNRLLRKGKKSQQRSKINTQNNYEEPNKFSKARQKIRKSINTVDQIQDNQKFILRMQKFNCFSNTDTFTNNRATLQNLPLLKKVTELKTQKNQPENDSNTEAMEINQFQLVVGQQKQEFTQKDLRIIFLTIENAYEFGRSAMKHRKSQSCILGEEDLMHPSEVGYIKQFFTMMANLHLNNKEHYDRIRLFIVSPYDSTVSQLTELNLIKNGSSSSNAMRESLKKIIQLHRSCVTRGQICKHLKYLLGKIGHFTINKQNNHS